MSEQRRAIYVSHWPEGEIRLEMPFALSQASFWEFDEWLDLIRRQAKRRFVEDGDDPSQPHPENPGKPVTDQPQCE